ncbi:hypothetical protein V500_03404 [Pseudogymnoascus sp. VKM F-4518 (FW-2643)]|nr:hypothetical protein V500_03404 [Pseudogymnoascus sp. VKM F-4518 (FW-2643)]
MDDDNVVVKIYPNFEGYFGAELSIRINAKHAGYLPPKCRPQTLNLLHDPDIFRRSDREMTVKEEEQDPLDCEACIKVTFDQIPKTRVGLRAGRSEDAELRLVELPNVSFYHFALTFDEHYRLVVRDLGSTCGTTVIYGRKERGPSNSQWIVGGSDFVEGISPIIVKVSQLMQFRLVIPRHNVHSKSYRDKVNIFRAGRDSDLLDLNRVDLVSGALTRVPTGVQTPASQSATVTVRRKLGEGGFAVVYLVWNVSNGEQYALKKPLKKPFDAGAWEEEALIMDRINHKHIVSLLNSCPGPEPWLHLEYMPEGSVQDKLDAGLVFSRYECKQIFAQASDALAYIHTLDPQIVHRDIKPSNILILHHRPNDIFIKFADFGLSREGDLLKTFCGTGLYLAPEVYEGKAIPRNERPPYTALVDIWSLGVVLVQLLLGLPKHDKKSVGVRWGNIVRQWVEVKLEVEGDDLSSFFLKMLCLRPDARKTATDCHMAALGFLSSSNSVVTRDHCSDSFNHGASTMRPSSHCPHLLDGLHLPDELDMCKEPRQLQVHKRNAVEAELDATIAPCHPHCISEKPTIGPVSQQQQKDPETAESINRLESYWFYGQDFIASSINDGNDVLSGWSPFSSAGPVSHNASNVGNDQTEPSVLEEYRPLSYIEQVGQSFREVQQPCEEARGQAAPSPTRATQTAHDELQQATSKQHLSTRSLMDDGKDFVYVVINRKRVSMRMEDFYLNATQICAAANLDKPRREKYISRLKKRGVVSVVARQNWVPFPDGVFLGQALKLAKDLKTLFSHAPIKVPAEVDNYLLLEEQQLPRGYASLQWNGRDITYNLSLQKINGTHLLRSYDINIREVKANLPRGCIPTTIKTGHVRTRGTWFSLGHAEQLCQILDLRDNPIAKIRELDT